MIYFSFRRIDKTLRSTHRVNCLSFRKAGLQSKEQYKKTKNKKKNKTSKLACYLLVLFWFSWNLLENKYFILADIMFYQ